LLRGRTRLFGGPAAGPEGQVRGFACRGVYGRIYIVSSPLPRRAFIGAGSSLPDMLQAASPGTPLFLLKIVTES